MDNNSCCERCEHIIEPENICIIPNCPCHSPKTEGLKIVPSPRIDYCSDCKTEHGYDCPKDKPLPTEWEKEFDKAWKFGVDDNQRRANVKSFISSLLASAEARGYERGQKDELEKNINKNAELAADRMNQAREEILEKLRARRAGK